MERARLGYVPALDGLRGVAILLVVGRHAFRTPVGGGYGVDVFFVLSGFLIATLLLDEHAQTGRIDFRGFYTRRARRLLPGLFAMLAVYLIVETLAGRASDAARRVAAGGFYTANIVQAFWPHVIGRSAIGPLWSLAQEEQFYLLAPFALLLLLRRSSPHKIRLVLATLIFLVIVERFALTAWEGPTQRIYVGPDTHCDGLLVGTLLAVTLRTAGGRAREWRLLGPVSVVALGLLAIRPYGFWLQSPLIVAVAAGLICCAVVQPGTLTTRLLSLRPLVFTGKISYSLYLWNAPLQLWLHGDAGHSASEPYSVAGAALATLLAFVVAWVSYRYVEQPFRRRRAETRELGHRAPVVLASPASEAAPAHIAYRPHP
jgi:peptidoglycan/LPS O-acetylase OafA/YrhL